MMMKKKPMFTVCAAVFGLLVTTGVFGQGYTGPGGGTNTGNGFTGPGSASGSRGRGELVTAAEVKDLWDDSRVTLQGTIVNQQSREKFTFRDSSGEIIVDIDRKKWRGLSIGENDRVEIFGEVDKERSGTQIDVKSIKKL